MKTTDKGACLSISRRAIGIYRHRIGCFQVEVSILRVEASFQRLLRWKRRNRWRQIRIRLRTVDSDCFNVSVRKGGDKLAVVAISETCPRRGIPEIECLRFSNITRAVKIRNEASHEVRNVFRRHGWSKHRRRPAYRFVVWQAIEAFEVVSASTTAVVPAKCFVDVVSRERGSGPVVSVRTRFGIHEEPIEQTKAQRERTMVGRDVLRLPIRPRGGGACTEDRQRRIAVSFRAIA